MTARNFGVLAAVAVVCVPLAVPLLAVGFVGMYLGLIPEDAFDVEFGPDVDEEWEVAA